MTDITPDVLTEIKNQKRSRGRPKKIDTIIKEMREKALKKRTMEEEDEESYFDLPFIPPNKKKVARKLDYLDLPFTPGKDSWTVPRIPLKRKSPQAPKKTPEKFQRFSQSQILLRPQKKFQSLLTFRNQTLL